MVVATTSLPIKERTRNYITPDTSLRRDYAGEKQRTSETKRKKNNTSLQYDFESRRPRTARGR